MLWSIKSICSAQTSAVAAPSNMPGNYPWVISYIVLNLFCLWRVEIAYLLTANICRHRSWAVAYFTCGTNKPQGNHCGNGQIWMAIRNVRQQSVLIMSQISSDAQAEIWFNQYCSPSPLQTQSQTHKSVFARVRRHFYVPPTNTVTRIIFFFFSVSETTLIQPSTYCLFLKR